MQLLLVTQQLQSFWIPYSLSISYMVVVKQIAPVGFPTGACLLKRFSNLIRVIGQKVLLLMPIELVKY